MFTNAQYTYIQDLCFSFMGWIGYSNPEKKIEIIFSNQFPDFMTPVGYKIYFRTSMNSSVSFDFYLTMCIHEFNHYIAQGIGDKEIVLSMRRTPDGRASLAQYDIEADILTYKFLKETINFSLIQAYETQYQNNVEHPRTTLDEIHKVSRFLGTISSLELLMDRGEDAIIVPSMFKFAVKEDMYLHKRKSLYIRKMVKVEIDEYLFNQGANVFLNGKSLTEAKFVNEARQLAKNILLRYEEASTKDLIIS